MGGGGWTGLGNCLSCRTAWHRCFGMGVGRWVGWGGGGGGDGGGVGSG